MDVRNSVLSSIPPVDELLKQEEINSLLSICTRNLLVKIIREYLSYYRQILFSLNAEELNTKVLDRVEIINGIKEAVYKKLSYNLKHVVNATGIVIHTNLGRAPLSDEALSILYSVSNSYSNLEMDLSQGVRGSRYDHVEELIKEITKAEAAMVVNNNAAAVMLVLNTMATGKEVIVSRGQLIEIGGSFRIPDVMKASSARLIEVGTTNKTHIWDYERAITEDTNAIMKVHTSNYRILGFTEDVSIDELVKLSIDKNIPVIEDIGSGVLVDLSKYGLPYEPTVQESISLGMDVVTFSGDKMLGGPQAGVIVGRKNYIEKMKKNPLIRAFRIDKLTLAALEATLKCYLDEEKAIKSIPVLNMLTIEKSELQAKAERLYGKLPKALIDRFNIDIEDEYSEVGGGAMPLHKLPSKVITIKGNGISINELEARLRNFDTPVITRILKNKIILDLRTIMEMEYDIIVNAIVHSLT